MAAIDDLLRQIPDTSLRSRLEQEFARISKNKKFGLVFEEHIPECTPLYDVPIKRGSTVALKTGHINDVYTVLNLDGDNALCYNKSTGDTTNIALVDLVSVAQFGEPIFPTLQPIASVENAPDSSLWHTLIEADNYHALQLLEYLYPRQVDCIYIDPPYNTGARDWKYNNDYVDSSDNWRHSKWLSMMQKRLKIARRILNPDTGILIVTIDEHEVHHLRTLLDELFPEAHIQMVTDVINYKGVSQGHFARVEEYIIYVFMPMANISSWYDRMLGENDPFSKKVTWASLLRRGSDSYRQDSPNLYYPILIDEKNSRVVKAGDVLPLGEHPDYDATIDGYKAAWPVRTDLSEGRWSMSNDTLNKMIELGYVSVGKYDAKRKTWPIKYLFKKQREQIERGEIIITGRNHVTGAVEVEYAEEPNQLVRTVWYRNSHNAGTYGTDMITNILNKPNTFSFPKSLYAVHDALGVVIKDNPNALIVDFFAGSGTTLHAVNLLNAEDSGHRRCILVTNNEVSVDEARNLQRNGYQPGDPEWEKQGICRAVTWPRTKYSILGKRDDGTVLAGDYFTTLTETKEVERSFYQLGFVEDFDVLTSSAKKQLISLLRSKEGKAQLPQTLVKTDSKFIVSDKHTASILFDVNALDEWLDALEDQDHIIDFYIVVKETAVFKRIKAQVSDLLGPISVTSQVKRPMSEGFPTNVEYFKLDFLDKNSVSLGQQFREILPLLWLKSGAIGKRPEISSSEEPEMLILPHNRFAILIDETKYAEFAVKLSKENNIEVIYFVTNSEEAFREMTSGIKVSKTYQLYRDYIDNFVLGSRRDS
ncbi:MAG: DNA methyltransferase [Clostridium botulinum]|jgi:adenine-specific DNA-methyltransferase|uniref:site-specific DNA-methyltransferase n=1 Tax=uncultured Clostridium sp. TaxID=59620 RepID=UPI00280A6B91|nr:DNA methyltransferase [uncultured Clostridium sp.]MDU6876633.1 DNA methyltransferase [Clostridium botulinum]